jgi:hypothetical protein
MKPVLEKSIAVPLLLLSAVLPGRGDADEMPSRAKSRAEYAGADVVKGAATVRVILDFAKIMTFEQPAKTIIIGNPAIVDGVLSDQYSIVLTGKGIGTTNMIVLGEGGQEVTNLVVNVVGNNSHQTTVYQGTVSQIYTCAGPCKPLAPAVPSK